jgi:hypothetical protein
MLLKSSKTHEEVIQHEWKPAYTANRTPKN